jgi:hypothetical protein
MICDLCTVDANQFFYGYSRHDQRFSNANEAT